MFKSPESPQIHAGSFIFNLYIFFQTELTMSHAGSDASMDLLASFSQ